MSGRTNRIERRGGVPDVMLSSDDFEAAVVIDSADGDRLKLDIEGTVKEIPTFSGDNGVPRYAAVAVSSAELLALRAAPKTLVAAPGAGKALVFHQAILLLDATATTYTETADNMAIKYKDGTGDAVSQTIEATGFIDQNADQLTVALPVIDPIVAKAVAENQPLVLHNTGDGEYAVGTGLMRVKVYYSVIDTGW